MSLELARKVNAKYPHLLQTNINATCSQFVDYLLVELKAAGRDAYRMCKTAGEGQYIPPGFQPRTVIGLDGKPYVCTGISHDAIWCDGQQYDTIARGNDSPDPIGMTGEPVWNAIPEHLWRPQNPPLKGGAPVPPVPQPPSFPYPDEATAVLAFQNRVKKAYKDVGRIFPDPNDADAYRHFARYGYDCHQMPEPDAQNKRVKELRKQLGAPESEQL